MLFDENTSEVLPMLPIVLSGFCFGVLIIDLSPAGGASLVPLRTGEPLTIREGDTLPVVLGALVENASFIAP